MGEFAKKTGIELDVRPGSAGEQTVDPDLLLYLALPSGSIVMMGATTIPEGFLACNGSSYLRSNYLKLFEKIGITFGSVDSTHFTVPSLADYDTGIKFVIRI